MENRQQQILSEIKSMMTSILSQIEVLEQKIEELQYSVDPKEMAPVVDMDLSTDLEIYVEDEPLDDDDDLPFFETTSEMIVEENVEADVKAEENVEENVEEVSEVQEEVRVKQTTLPVIDAMAAKQAWRTDMPGSPVRDIRSAISLNDRILFINLLFNEDPMSFQEGLTKLNSMSSFEEAVTYIVDQHPEWDLESDTVYRFMMALRRRLQ